MENKPVRIHSFGKSKASEVLDKLLQDYPASKSVGKFLNKYRVQCADILEMPNKSTASAIINRMKRLWIEDLESRNWPIDIKHYTQNVLIGIYRDSLEKLHKIRKKHNNP